MPVIDHEFICPNKEFTALVMVKETETDRNLPGELPLELVLQHKGAS